MSSTPRGERLIITFLGNRNGGKSSLINALTDREWRLFLKFQEQRQIQQLNAMNSFLWVMSTFCMTLRGWMIWKLGEKIRAIRCSLKLIQQSLLMMAVLFRENELNALQRLKEMKLPVLVIFNKSSLSESPITKYRILPTK